MCAARREAVNPHAARGEHGWRPRGNFAWLATRIPHLVNHFDGGSGGRHLHHHLLLQAGQRFYRLGSFQDAAGHVDPDGAIIGGVTLHRVFGRNPQAVPAAGLPAGLTRFAQLAGELFEEVLAAHEAVMHDARADIPGDDGLYFTIRDPVAVGPALEVRFFDFDHT